MSDQSAPPAAAPRLAQPGDVTLLKGILRPWVASGLYQPHDASTGVYIQVADVSCASPEDLPGRFRATVSLNGDCVWYFVSPHAKLHGGKRKGKVRTTSDGTTWWRDEGADKQILDPDDGNRLIGHRKMLSLMLKNNAGGPDVRVGWIMHELYLHHHQDGGPGRINDSAVLAGGPPSTPGRPRVAPRGGARQSGVQGGAQEPEPGGPASASTPGGGVDLQEPGEARGGGGVDLQEPGEARGGGRVDLQEPGEARGGGAGGVHLQEPGEARGGGGGVDLQQPGEARGGGGGVHLQNPEKPEAAAAASTFNNPEKPEAAAAASTFNNPEKPEAAASPVKKPEKLEAAAATHKEPEKPEAAAWIAENTNEDAGPACKKLKRVAGAPAVAGHLLCPKCGFHVGALQLTSTAELSG